MKDGFCEYNESAGLLAQGRFCPSGRQRSFAAQRLQNSHFLLWQKVLKQLRRPRPIGLDSLAAQAALAKIDIPAYRQAGARKSARFILSTPSAKSGGGLWDFAV
jgi:hypothetical protein